MDRPVAANVLGTTSAICWSIQLLPQIMLNYRRHNATGLQPSMMMFWAWAGVPLGVYNIVSNFNIALRVQAQILVTLSLITWSQVYYYEHRWSLWKCVSVVIPVAAVMGTIEFALIVALQKGEQREVRWPVTLMAVLAALFLALGVLRHYLDIGIHRTVRGISFIFCGIDAMGDITGLISIVFEPRLNILGIIIYGVEFVLWCGIFAAGGYYNLRMWMSERVSERGREVPRRDESMRVGVHGARQDHNGHGAVMHHENASSTSAFRTASLDGGVGVQQRRGIDDPISLSNC